MKHLWTDLRIIWEERISRAPIETTLSKILLQKMGRNELGYNAVVQKDFWVSSLKKI